MEPLGFLQLNLAAPACKLGGIWIGGERKWRGERVLRNHNPPPPPPDLAFAVLKILSSMLPQTSN